MRASTARIYAAETLDRVVASIGNVALTLSDVETEYRLERFLEGEAPELAPAPAELEQVRDRLVSQKLLEQEAEAEGILPPDLSEKATEALGEVRRKFASEQLFQSALRSLRLDEQEVLGRLTRHARTLWFIDQRLRPSAWVEQVEVEAYYHETFAPEHLERTGKTAPPLAAVEPQIREVLVQRKLDQLLATWLEELKSTQRVKVHTF